MAFLVDQETSIRYLHILSGITWIGMLYFFNFVNLPLLKIQLKKPYEANMAEKASAHIAIKTLFFFRWGAFFTLLFGLLLIGAESQAVGLRFYFLEQGMKGYSILLGVILALVMFFNVWFIIWPRQQKILANNKAIAASTDDAEKKRLGDLNAPMVKEATMASRANTWLSIPMLWGMVFGAHGPGGDFGQPWYFPLAVLGALLIVMAAYSQTPKPKTPKAPSP
ncbi:MAG: hypothetical protein QOJ26_810 [Thermoplasmata archaeon]|jgi:uncharacterized membrane protein|nr:hypothetical protein [Thermoplasmata archaeon]MEA3165941.1 hypothetical protein [Thermoplasmata archaeon]